MRRIQRQMSTGQQRWNKCGLQFLRVVQRAILASAVLAIFTALASAQSTSQLNGSVADPSGAAVAGAKITLTDPANGSQRSTTSNAAGFYQFLDIPPGDYRLEAKAAGFTPYVSSKVTLQVKLPSTIPIRFQVAGVQQSVNVEGEAPLINRTDASLGNVVEGNQIDELPIAARNVVQLLSLQPGVAYLGDELDQDTDTRSGAVNGLRSDQSNVTLDGIGVNDQNNGYAFTSVLNIPPDSVEEFRVTTANANADSGYSSGAQVALVTKSGTNNFHGSAYEYNRNTIFSANDPVHQGFPVTQWRIQYGAQAFVQRIRRRPSAARSRRTASSSSPTMKGSGKPRAPARCAPYPAQHCAQGNLQYLCHSQLGRQPRHH